MRAMGRPGSRFHILRLCCLTLCGAFALTSCQTEPVGGVAVTLDDPLGIFDPPGITLTPPELRVVIFPATTCDPATGRLTPEPSTAPGATFAEAVVDLTIPLAERTGRRIEVPAGTYTILVRGRGTDRVTMETDQVIASGCATESIAEGGTKGVTLTMREVTGMGTCGNRTTSPDEQCDDGNTTDGDGCSARCQTEALAINNADMADVQQGGSIAWGRGSGDTARAIVGYQTDTGGFALGMRFLDDSGAALPAPLDRDVVADNRAGVQLDVVSAVGGGRVLLAYRDIFPNDGASDVRVRSFRLDAPTAGGTVATEATLATEGGTALVASPASMGRQASPAAAVLGDGNGIVVFENPMSATGLSGRVYAPTATVGSGAGAFVIGAGATGGLGPVVTATSSGFLVAYLAGANVFVQTVDSAGTAGVPVMVATRTGAPGPGLAIGALETCIGAGPCALLAWDDAAADTGLNAILVTASGSAVGTVFPVVMGAGDERDPSVAGGADRFVVAWTGTDGVRARIFGADGMPALNRERPQTSDAFLVAPGGTAPSASVGGRTASYLLVWNDPTQDAAGGVRGRAIPF